MHKAPLLPLLQPRHLSVPSSVSPALVSAARHPLRHPPSASREVMGGAGRSAAVQGAPQCRLLLLTHQLPPTPVTSPYPSNVTCHRTTLLLASVLCLWFSQSLPSSCFPKGLRSSELGQSGHSAATETCCW